MKKILLITTVLVITMVTMAFAEDMDLRDFTDAELDGLERAIALEREARANMATPEEADKEDINGTQVDSEESSVEAFEVLRNGVWAGNANVKILQAKLVELGFLRGRADGIFGPGTEKALKDLQKALGWEQTGEVKTEDELNTIQSLTSGDGTNMVWDGRFQNREAYWSNWGNPTTCEIIEIDGQNWMHLVSSGTHWEGLCQDISRRSGDNEKTELVAGQQYTLSFKAFAADNSVGKSFACGIHNVSLEDNTIQQQHWTDNPVLVLNNAPTVYRLFFTPTVEGSFRVMIGQGSEGIIEAYFTDVKLETGSIATEWSESPDID